MEDIRTFVNEWGFVLILILVFGFAVFFVVREYLRQRRYDRSPQFTARATLVERYLKGGTSGRNGYSAYYGIFETTQGDILELRMYRDQYYNLPENAVGLLTWQGEDLLEFKEVEA